MKDQMVFYFDLLFEMTSREIKARYKNTAFGFLWAFINPILQMIVIGIILQNFVRIDNTNYYVFVYSGLILWNFFSSTLIKTTPSILYDRALIRKAKFPYSVIPLSIIFSNFIQTLPSLGIILIVTGLLRPTTIYLVLSLLCSVFLLLLFTIGISLCTTALNVRFRDINFFIQALLIVWFYATPILYPASMLPTTYNWIWVLNPLTTIVQLAQYATSNSPPPPVILMSINSATIVLMFILGIFIFETHSPYFDDLI